MATHMVRKRSFTRMRGRACHAPRARTPSPTKNWVAWWSTVFFTARRMRATRPFRLSCASFARSLLTQGASVTWEEGTSCQAAALYVAHGARGQVEVHARLGRSTPEARPVPRPVTLRRRCTLPGGLCKDESFGFATGCTEPAGTSAPFRSSKLFKSLITI